jgi:hypothetical protein
MRNICKALTRSAAFLALALSAHTLRGVQFAHFSHCCCRSSCFWAGKLTAGRGFEKVESYTLGWGANQVDGTFRDAVFQRN